MDQLNGKNGRQSSTVANVLHAPGSIFQSHLQSPILQASEINTLVRLGNYRTSGPPVPFSPLEHNSQCVNSHFLVSPQLNPNAILNFGKFADLKRLWEFAAHRLQQPHCGPCTNLSSDPYKDHVPVKVVPNRRQDESLWHAYNGGIFRVLLHLSGLRGRPSRDRESTMSPQVMRGEVSERRHRAFMGSAGIGGEERRKRWSRELDKPGQRPERLRRSKALT